MSEKNPLPSGRGAVNNGKRVRFSSFDEIRERGRSVFVLQEDIRN